MDAAADKNRELVCTKYNRSEDNRDPHCSDPKLYCKYRSACLIHFMEKENRRGGEGSVVSGR